MDAVDRKLVFEAEKGLLLTAQPFDEIASKIGIPTQEVIERLKKLQESGVIRRFGVSLRPSSIGYCANALVAWKVPQSRVQEVGAYFAGFNDISHCYERETVTGLWDYNIYTVIHGADRGTVEELVKLLSSITSLTEYLIIYSKRNLKNPLGKEITKC
ncbi:MAG: Lrp/AsnC family transcriptional regulator [Candidatus Bathyarchaeia archaeon]|jgi:DNA-binding Lrp family transcriptional regulator